MVPIARAEEKFRTLPALTVAAVAAVFALLAARALAQPSGPQAEDLERIAGDGRNGGATVTSLSRVDGTAMSAAFGEPLVLTARVRFPGALLAAGADASNLLRPDGRVTLQVDGVTIASSAALNENDPLPVCSDCHTAHMITRTDAAGFRLEIMTKCGRCHAEIAKSYFDTYHGKVSQLGYGKTAKCHDCHGSHDILPPSDPASHLSRAHVVETCQKCHPSATRRFAGYLTHATHHDPKKYPVLYWTFWGMVSLLVGTFTVGGLHTLLWLPRALQMRRERQAAGESPVSAESPAGEPEAEKPETEEKTPEEGES